MPVQLTEIHPILVHFPIALLVVGVTLDLAAALLRRRQIADVATWFLLFGLVGAAGALLSGQLIEDSVDPKSAADILRIHQVLAYATSATFTALVAARLVWLAPRIFAALAPVSGAVKGVEQRTREVLPFVFAPTPNALIVAYLAISVVGIILLTLTGYYGGSMVYHHGVGVQP